MPQFELDDVHGFTGRQRGRSPEEAVRRAIGLSEADVRVDEAADLHGWQSVRVDGEPTGRVRLHQRMQFRRD